MTSDPIGPLERLRDDLGAVRLELDVPGADEARRVRDDLVAQVEDYVLPRLRRLDAPALIVVGGSTGAGKSTLVNSLVGSVVSPAGVLRPTTRAPVLACNPQDVPAFEGDRVLPGLARVTGGAGAAGTLQLVSTNSLPSGLALLDSPDIDSVLAENRALANQLLAAADGWLFVTTAARYADAVPWEFLRSARERGTALSIVLNRVPADADREVPTHLRRMLRGALASLPVRALVVERAAMEQLAAAAELRAEADHAYADALREVETALRSGALLRGEVLARWHEVVGTGDVMRALETRVGWLRDRLKSIVTGAPAADAELKVAVEHRVEAVVRTAAERAAERTARGWREGGPGRPPPLA